MSAAKTILAFLIAFATGVALAFLPGCATDAPAPAPIYQETTSPSPAAGVWITNIYFVPFVEYERAFRHQSTLRAP